MRRRLPFERAESRVQEGRKISVYMRRSFFRYIVILIAALAATIALFSCGSVKNLYFERYDSKAIYYLDSLTRKHQIDIGSYKDWNVTSYYGSDSVRTNIYTAAFRKADSLFIMSVTENEGDSLKLFRFRREVHK